MHPLLAPFVASVYQYEGELPHGRELALATGRAQLVVNLAEDAQRWYDGPGHGVAHTLPAAATVRGPSTGPLCIDTAEQRSVVGVSFRPGGAYPFFGVLPAGAYLPLAECWGDAGAALADRLRRVAPAERVPLVEALLVDRLGAGPDPFVARAVALLDRGVPVGVVADRLGVTDRGLARRFASRVGCPPKRYARVRRFQRAARLAAESLAVQGFRVDWAGVAARCGYVDQSHLIHDFREFAGVTPGRYVPRGPAAHNHLPVSDFANPVDAERGRLGPWTSR
ncbi:MAG TPA: helix-turn-helix transcriptional regulator [Actinocatenispora sp.]